MSLTRDQLRAARALLRLRQDQLAEIAEVGVATIRRYEGGRDVGAGSLDALRRALEGAGAILLEEEDDATSRERGVGVALRRRADLPVATRARVSATGQRS